MTTHRTLAIFVLAPLLGFTARAQDRAAWMKEAKFGVMTHFLAEWIDDDAHSSIEAWNKFVDDFDPEALAEQLESVGAKYHLLTIGQNSGYYICPNATYDKFVGIHPSKLSNRDLVSDVYEALHKRGIRLMVYFPAGAPAGDPVAIKALDRGVTALRYSNRVSI